MATGLRLRYGNLRIKDVQLVLHLPYMSVPFRLKQDRGMFSQFTLNKTKDKICDMQGFVATEAVWAEPGFQREGIIGVDVRRAPLGKSLTAFRFVFSSHYTTSRCFLYSCANFIFP
ncbi:hypothetical protein ABIB66_006539 [Bradyrhizobium sp. F1.13.3]